MSITIGGWILFSIIAITILLLILFIPVNVFDVRVKNFWKPIGIAIILDILILMAFNWYYTNTATGIRAVKTQHSELNNGVNRIVTVYDVEGNIIKRYEGKFDVIYDNDRILFDDEKGFRHIIYYPTGTVTIDEVE